MSPFGETERLRARDFAAKLSMRVLSRMWQMLLKGITEVQAATRPAAAAEMVLVRIGLCRRHADAGRSDKDARPERWRFARDRNRRGAAERDGPDDLRGSVHARSIRFGSIAGADEFRRRGAGAEASARPQVIAPMSEAQGAPAARRIASFPELVALAGEKRDLLTKAALEADVRLVRLEDGRLEVTLERSAARTLINDLSRKLEQWTGRRWTVIVSNEAGQPTLRSQYEVERNQRERAAEADPRVKEVLARFPGTKVVEVRRLAPEPPESDVSGEDPAESSDSDDYSISRGTVHG